MKKLTEKEKEEKIVLEVVKAVEKLQKRFPQHLLERGIMRYKNNRATSRKLTEEIAEREEELATLRQKAVKK